MIPSDNEFRDRPPPRAVEGSRTNSVQVATTYENKEGRSIAAPLRKKEKQYGQVRDPIERSRTNFVQVATGLVSALHKY
jgi:hypothetical protein